MFSSSLLYTSAAYSSPVVVPNYYHHLDDQQDQLQHQLLQESDFENPNPVQDAATDYVLPNGCTITPFGKSKAMDMMPESAEAIPKKIKSKPDNRSKVRTAQGLRDRRVRMSIGIARKFFDLQDLLGFDKPSRTLEWLLTNSNKAILELASPASSLSTPSDQATTVVKRLGNGHNEAVQLSCNGALKSIMKQKAALLAKESRVKSRARARARTVEKLSTANFNQQKTRLLNNPEDMMSSDIHQTYLGSIPLMKSVESESQMEEERKTIRDHEQHIQNQQLQLQNYDSLNKSYHHWSGLNSSSSLDQWDINCAYPHQGGSSASHQLNLSRDITTSITGRDCWDAEYSHGHYKTL